jgi:hypothetical protein
MSYHEKIKRGTTRQLWQFFMVSLLSVFFFVGLSGVVSAATQWVSNPATCNMLDATNFPGQNCDPERICGDSSGIAQCYNTATLLPPAISATSNTLYSASYPNGGYILNCYATKDSAAPFCDNNGAYWCNRSNTCYTTQQRDTTCTANTWATATCGSCRTGYGDCNLDGGVCEVQFNVTNYPTGGNNHYGTTCNIGDVRCDTGYYDCDATGVAVGNGCEALRSGTCTTGGGLTGTWSCSVDAGGSCTDGGSNYTCTCVPPKQYFETGTKAQYGTSDPLLWGVQFGAGRLIQFGNSSNEQLFAVNNDGSVELASITAPATTTNKLYNVAGSLYWNGVMIGAGASGGGGWVDDGTVVRLETATDFVGIGTATPDYALTVYGGPSFNEYFRVGDGRLMWGDQTDGIHFFMNRDGGETSISSSSNIDIGDIHNSFTGVRMSIDGPNGNVGFLNGNVGVGTSTPTVPLHVISNSGTSTYFQVDDNSRGGVYIGNGSYYSTDEAGLYDAGGDVPLAVYDANDNLVHYTNNFTISAVSSRAAIGTNGIEESAVLLLDGNGGFLMPRMTTLMRDSIVSPATALQIYNTQTQRFEYFDGVSWLPVDSVAGDAWVLTGNAGTDPSINFIGTTDYQPLVFKTEDNEWMRLTEDGYLGVGIDSPEQNFSVKGDVLIGQNEDTIIPAGGIDRNLYLRARDGSLPGNQGSVNINFQRNTNDLARINVNTANAILLQPYNSGAWQNGLAVANNGYVGIKNNSPKAILDIGEGMINTPSGDTSILLTHDGGETFLETASTDMAEGLLMHGANGGASYDYGVVRQIASSGYANGWDRGLHIFSGDDGNNPDPIIFSTDGNEVARMADDGKVSIGTSVGRSLLTVYGNDRALTWLGAANNSQGPAITFFRARGSKGAELGVSQDDLLGTLEFRAQTADGGVVKPVAGIAAYASTTFNSTDDAAGYLTFSTFQHASGMNGFKERMRIDDYGYVGIGSTSPSARFHVEDGDGAFMAITDGANISNYLYSLYGPFGDSSRLNWDFSAGGAGGKLRFLHNSTAVMDLESSGVTVNRNGTNTVDFNVRGNDLTYVFSVDVSDRMVGIGTNTPLSKLHIHDSSDFFSMDRNFLYFSDTMDINHSIYSPAGDSTLYWNINANSGNGSLVFESDGRQLVELYDDGTSGGLYINSWGLDDVNFSVYNNAANLLFGTDVNNDLVMVNGTLQINDPSVDGYAFPLTDGTNGQALVTDGAGNLSWASAGSGGGWSLTGNAGTNPVTNFLGTTDNQALVFRTNNTEQVRITNAGNVGIGTSTPGAYRLNVQGNGYFSIGEDFNAFMVYNSPKDSIQFRIDGDNDNVLLQEDSGRVGIGTGSPSASLHVYGGPSDPVIARFANTDVPDGFGFGSDLYGGEAGLYEMSGGQLLVGHDINNRNILMLGQELAYGDQASKNFSLGTNTLSHSLLVQGSTTHPGDNLFKVQGGANGGYFSVYTPDDDDRNTTIEWQRELRFNVGTTNKQAMVIANTGNVGIGTERPDSLLHVNTTDGMYRSVAYGLRLSHYSDGISDPPAPGFGAGLEFELENSAGVKKVSGAIDSTWWSAANGNEAANLIFKTLYQNDLSEVMRATYYGYVGIGVTDPVAVLDVKDRWGDSGGFGLRVENQTGNDNELAYFVNYGNRTAMLLLNVGVGASSRPALTIPTGRVGLGTYEPEYQLTSTYDVLVGQLADSATPGLNGLHRNLYIRSYDGSLPSTQGTSNLVFQRNESSVTTDIARVGIDVANNLLLQHWNGSAWVSGMTVKNNQNVGFDQSNPSAKLHVGNTSAGSAADYNYLWLEGAGDVQHKLYLPTGSNLMVWDFNGTDNGGAIEFRDYGTRIGMFTNSGLVINEGGVTGVGLRVEGDTQTHLLYTDATNDYVGIGTNTPGLRFHVVQASNAVAAFDRTGNDGTIISIRQDGTEEGTISVSGNTVSYNAFTGSHYTWHEGTIEKGTLVSMTGKNKRLNDNEKSEVLYGVEVTKQINSPKVLGSYLSILEPEQALSNTNPALVMAVGNGEVWVADKGENIEAGDYLISSDVAGHAQKMDSDYALNYVVARAAEDIDWSDVKEKTIDGAKHKMITVFFDSLVVNTQTVDVIKSNQMLGSKLNLAKMAIADANKIKKQLGGEMKASSGSSTAIGGMQVGQATIPGKNTSVRVTFANEYSAPPIVMLTLASDSSLMRYFVSNVTELGFTLNLYPSQYQDTLFNWQAYPGSDVKSAVVSEAILEDLPEYEVPVIVPPQDYFLPAVPNKEDNTLNLNGAEDVLYNSGLSIVEVGDELGTTINEEVVVEVPAEASIEVPATPEISETPAENLE